jgi:endonuclease/exonuclease/phosphatase family metal-dependent hydrolase/ribonuclease HI
MCHTQLAPFRGTCGDTAMCKVPSYAYAQDHGNCHITSHACTNSICTTHPLVYVQGRCDYVAPCHSPTQLYCATLVHYGFAHHTWPEYCNKLGVTSVQHASQTPTSTMSWRMPIHACVCAGTGPNCSVLEPAQLPDTTAHAHRKWRSHMTPTLPHGLPQELAGSLATTLVHVVPTLLLTLVVITHLLFPKTTPSRPREASHVYSTRSDCKDSRNNNTHWPDYWFATSPTAHNDVSIGRNGGGKKVAPKTIAAAYTGDNHTNCFTLQYLGLFCEPQQRAYCGIHALNALFGRKIVDAVDVIQYLQINWHVGGCHPRPSYTVDGNFSVNAINRWLFAHIETPVMLVPFLTNIGTTATYTREEMLAIVPQGCDRIFVWFVRGAKPESPLEGIHHYKCLRRSDVDGQWYQLDSMDAGMTALVSPMHPTEWTALKGDMYFAANLDASQYSNDCGWCTPRRRETVAKLTNNDISKAPLADLSNVIVSPLPIRTPRLPPPSRVAQRQIVRDRVEQRQPGWRDRPADIDLTRSLDVEPVTLASDYNNCTIAEPPAYHAQNIAKANDTTTSRCNNKNRTRPTHGTGICKPQPKPTNQLDSTRQQTAFRPKEMDIRTYFRRTKERPMEGTASEEKSSRSPMCCASLPPAPTTHSSREPHATSDVRDLPHAEISTKLNVMTWNVRGLTRVDDELHDMIDTYSPDFMLLTETKLTDRLHGKQYVRNALPNYVLRYSSVPQQTRPPHQTTWQGDGACDASKCVPDIAAPRSGRAGVITAIAKKHTHLDPIQTISTPTHPHGNLQLTMLQPKTHASRALLVGSVYLPCDSHQERSDILTRLSRILQDHHNDVIIVAGDFNLAADHPQLKGFLKANSLHKLCPSNHGDCSTTEVAPLPTHVCDADIGTHREIDHIFIRLPEGVEYEANTRLLEHSGLSDHKPILAEITIKHYYYKPSPRPLVIRPEPRLVTPIPLAKLESYHHKVQHQLGDEIQQLHNLALENRQRLEGMWHTMGQDYPAMVDALSEGHGCHDVLLQHRKASELLISVTHGLNNVATTTLEYYTPGQKHARKFLSRKLQQWLRTLLGQCKYLNSLTTTTKEYMQPMMKACNTTGEAIIPICKSCVELMLRLMRVHERYACIRDKMADNAPPIFPSQLENVHMTWEASLPHVLQWLHDIKNTHRHLRQRMWVAKQTERKASTKKYRRHWQKILATQPKKGYKHIFKRSSNHEDNSVPTNLSQVRNPISGCVTSDPDEVLAVVADFFGKQQTPVGGSKHGRYGNDDSLRNYPFQCVHALDSYTLQPRPGMCTSTLALDMTNDIMHGGLVRSVLARTGRHKAPGPDGIPYELIKFGGDLLLSALEHFMVGIWFTTEHPWHTSNTALLYKKHDPLEVKNYRPIGLTNTMYKLWTGVLTEVLSTQAERYQVLSACQEGFRPYKNTIRQLSMVVNVLEDAKLHQHDVYMMFVDFTSAFNTTDHDKLLQIMYDMGFPHIAIDNVRGIYREACTSVLTPYGPTAPLPVGRGTIQGDTLSPFLFLVFMEPLLRWLHSGGRGYKFGCLDLHEQLQHQCSSPAYADDLVCITNTPQDMYLQAQKVSAYCDWAKMSANASKCAVTGIRYAMEGKQQSNPISDNAVNTVRRSLEHLTIQGQRVPFHHPDKQPYDYLGVPLTLTLNYRWYLEKVTQALREKTNMLSRSFASGPQQLRTLQQCIIPGATYAFPITPLGLQDVDRCDAILAKSAKQAFRLPNYMPNRMVHLRRDEGGLGLDSLRVQFYQLGLAALVKTLNDLGTLGKVSRALLTNQLASLQGLSPHELPREARYMRLAKQLAMAMDIGLEVTRDGQAYEPEISCLVESLRQVTYDPKALGLRESIPPRIYRTLMQLGITNLVDLTCESGTHMITASDLARRYGSKVNHRHKKAINTLTMLLNAHAPDGLTLPTAGLGDLHRTQRKINHGYLATELCTSANMLPNNKITNNMINLLRRGAPTTTQGGTNDTAPPPRSAARAQITKSIIRTGVTRPEQVPADPNYAVPSFILDIRLTSAREPLNGDTADWRAIFDNLSKNRNFTRHYRQQQLQRAHGARAALANPSTSVTIKGQTYVLDKPTIHPSHTPRPLPLANHMAFRRAVFTYDNLPARHMQALYGDDAIPQAFLAERVAKRQKQLLVRWKPSIVMKHHLQPWASLGYTPRSTSSIAKQLGRGIAKHALEVEWNDTWEPLSTMKESLSKATFDALYTELRVLHAPTHKPPPPPKRHDAHLDEHARTGFGIEPPPTTPTPSVLRSYITIIKEAVNPDMDVNPNAGKTCYMLFRDCEFHVQSQYATHITNSVEGGSGSQGSPQAYDVCHSYCPQGRYMGSIPWTRVEWLYQRYRAGHQHEPYAMFKREVALLLSRYSNDKLNASNKLSSCWTSTKPLVDSLIYKLQEWSGDSILEVMTSPLQAAMPQSAHAYWGQHPADEAFGAVHDPYTIPWTGMTVYHPLCVEHNDMDTAMRWAIGSAIKQANTPVTTLLMLPDRPGTAYKRWLTNHMAGEVTTIPRSCFCAAFDNTKICGQVPCGRFISDYNGEPKWDMKVILVANDAGLRQYGNREALSASIRGMLAVSLGLPHLDVPHPTPKASFAQQLSMAFRIPRRLRQLPRVPDINLPAYGYATSAESTQYAAAKSQELHQRVDIFRADKLKWSAVDIVYTDGSCIEDAETGHRLGAGVCRPRCSKDTTYVEPCGRGPTNTITRAELCALVHATGTTCDIARDEVVATDSLCSLHMIHRGMRQPNTLRHCKHKDVIHQIVSNIRARAEKGVRTTLIKVKAHTGVCGNEQADAIAKAVATQRIPSDGALCHITLGSSPYEDVVWLAAANGIPPTLHTTTPTTQQPTNTGVRSQPPGRHTPYYLNNLTSELAARAYALQGVKGTNDGVYSQLMRDEVQVIDKKSSMAFWDMEQKRELTYNHVVNTMRARWGGIYTAKTAVRMGVPYFCAPALGYWPAGACPLCGQPDSTTHILGECPEHKHLHIQRHDSAGRCLLKHIRKGARGGDFIVADVGSRDKLVSHGITEKTIPSWLLPGRSFSPSRVDVAVIRAPTETTKEQRPLATDTCITLVELGFRKDYDAHLTKVSEKTAQHSLTKELLLARYPDTELQIWDIGYTGMIPSRLLEHAKRLGVQKVDKLMKDIHKIAVNHSLLIIHDRRQKEQLLARCNVSAPPQHNRYYVPVDRQHTRAPPR